MLEKNLPDEDKQLFRDYLDSCKNKLQIERNTYNYFYEQEWVLTGFLVFGIIAAATVLTISLLEIYAATWFFWLGIVGVVLTVAVGIRLFLCIKENCNDLQELDNDFYKEGKSIEQKIAEIDHALKVYDLEKIRIFQDPQTEEILTLDANEEENKKILNNNEINAMEQNNNDIKLEPSDTEKNIDNPPFL